MKIQRRPHDEFLCELLGEPGTAGALLRERLPPELVATFAEGEPEILPDTFVHPKLRRHQADRLFRVKLRDGGQAYVYCLIEHKSSPEPRIRLQLLRYLTDLWVRLSGQPEHRLRLPMVVPLVIYNGTKRWGGHKRFSDRVEAVPALRPLLLDFPFEILDLGREPDEALSHDPHLEAGLRLLKYAFVLPAGERVEVLVWLLKGFRQEFLPIALTYRIKVHREIDEPEIMAVLHEVVPGKEEEMYSKAALKIRERGREEGVAEGKQEGVKEATRANVLRLLERRFGVLPDSIRERVASAQLTELDAWFDRGLDAQSLAEVFDGQGR